MSDTDPQETEEVDTEEQGLVEEEGLVKDRRPLVPGSRWWDVLPGDYNELTRELDGYRADAEAERRRQDLWGY